jgi:hypothetical protein
MQVGTRDLPWHDRLMATEHPLSRGDQVELADNFDQVTSALIVSAIECGDGDSVDAIVEHPDAEQITDWLKDTAWYSDLDGDLPWVEDIELYRVVRESTAAGDRE